MTNTSGAQVTATSTKLIFQELTKHFFNLKTVLLLLQENQDDGPIGLSAKAIAVSTGTLESRKGVAR